MPSSVVIVGSGVVGLTTAITLAERGHGVTVYCDPVLQHPIASRVAPALFTPYPGPKLTERFQFWTTESLKRLGEIESRESEQSGVQMGVLREYFYGPRHVDAWFDRILETSLLPSRGIEGVVGKRLHLDTLLYVGWLRARAAGLKVRFVERHITTFDELKSTGAKAIVNCAGLGARQLTHDPALVAMRGIVVHIPNEIGLEYSIHDDAPEGKVAYIFKFRNHLVLGGTFEPNREDYTIEPGAIEGIVDRCQQLLKVDGHPRWNELSVKNSTRTLIGLRPARVGPGTYEDIRLEIDRSHALPVIHNYGHCRQGISISWGTAADAANLFDSL